MDSDVTVNGALRAAGGVGINTNATEGLALRVAGDARIEGQMWISDVPPQGDLSMGSYTNRP